MARRYNSVDRFGVSLLLALGLAGCASEESSGGDVLIDTNTSDTSTSGTTPPDTEDTGDSTSPAECRSPAPLIVGGQFTGFTQCEGGALHRDTIVACPSLLPRTTSCEDPSGTNTCTTDADCTQSANGYCHNEPWSNACMCTYGCTSDADCGAGSVCLCADPVGQCAPASCTSDASCGDGFLCLTYVQMPGCGGTAFACQTPNDTCASNADCGPNQSCTFEEGRFLCADNNCVIGRPFIVEGDERTAPPVKRGDWLAAGLSPSLDGLNVAQRGILAAHWTQIGLMEHASVAAFARFAMQLMALGAPPNLLIETQAAMADEMRHACQAFALASAYAGAPVGPGPLSIDGALGDVTLREVLQLVIREGCIGETVAAVEASEAAGRVRDPVVKEVLSRITEEEGRHAALAWRTVQWALAEAQTRGDFGLRAFIEAEFDAAAPQTPSKPVTAEDEALVSIGVVGESLRAELRRQAIVRVIRPCLRACLQGALSGGGALEQLSREVA